MTDDGTRTVAGCSSNGSTSKVDVTALCEDATTKAVEAVKAAAVLPKRGTDYELYNVDNKFMAVNQNFRARIGRLLHQTLASAGYLLNTQAKFDTMSELVQANDFLLGRAALDMDSHERNDNSDLMICGIDGKSRKPHEAVGRDSAGRYANLLNKDNFTPVVIPKPQNEFKEFIHNEDAPFAPKLDLKHHARVVSLSGKVTIKTIPFDAKSHKLNEHPYMEEINACEPTPGTFDRQEQAVPDLDATPLIMVDNEAALRDLVRHLNAQTEFAVDVEHHAHRSFLGLTCLVQISTRAEDFVLDPFPIWHLMGALNEPFANPSILKVLHGAESDVIWLQRDFGVHLVNMVDTYELMKVLNWPKKSFQYLVQTCLGVALDKKLQKADWRIRPLTDDHIRYARSDTHYLLPALDRLCTHLRDRAQLPDAFEAHARVVFDRSKETSLKVFRQPRFEPDGYKMLSVKELNNRQLHVLRAMWEWRDQTARAEDESTEYVTPDHMMLHIAQVLPREVQGILACCSPIPPLLKRDIFIIHKFVSTGRDLPLEEKHRYESEMSLQDEVRNRLLHANKYTRDRARLDARFDQRDVRVDDDRAGRTERMEAVFGTSGPVKPIRRRKTQPLLPFRAVRFAPRPKVLDKLQQVRCRFAAWTPPYLCYLVALEQKERQESAQPAQETAVRYSHHCPAPPRSQRPPAEPVKEEPMDVAAPTEAFIRNRKHRKLQPDSNQPKRVRLA